MQIVIDIPDNKIAIEYGKVVSIGRNNDKELADYIFAGTPLPKGHGRLIDADALKKDDEVTEWISINPIRTGKMLNQFSKLFVKKIDDAPTIIEADKEEE